MRELGPILKPDRASAGPCFVWNDLSGPRDAASRFNDTKRRERQFALLFLASGAGIIDVMC